MPNSSRKFIDPAGTYTGGYSSNTLNPTAASHRSIQTRGVIQVDIASGTVVLQMRVADTANWVTVKTYAASAIDEIVLANSMRVVASAAASAYLGEIV